MLFLDLWICDVYFNEYNRSPKAGYEFMTGYEYLQISYWKVEGAASRHNYLCCCHGYTWYVAVPSLALGFHWFSAMNLLYVLYFWIYESVTGCDFFFMNLLWCIFLDLCCAKASYEKRKMQSRLWFFLVCKIFYGCVKRPQNGQNRKGTNLGQKGQNRKLKKAQRWPLPKQRRPKFGPQLVLNKGPKQVSKKDLIKRAIKQEAWILHFFF